MTPVEWMRTLWAAQRTRKSSLRVDSCSDQVGEVAVVGVAAGFGAQDGHGVVRDGVPFAEERRGLRVEEDEPGVAGGAFGVRVDG